MKTTIFKVFGTWVDLLIFRFELPEKWKNRPMCGKGLIKLRYMMVSSLNLAVAQFGVPERIRVDNGPEFISKEVDLWAYAQGVVLDFSRPGKPTDNAFIESFNTKLQSNDN